MIFRMVSVKQISQRQSVDGKCRKSWNLRLVALLFYRQIFLQLLLEGDLNLFRWFFTLSKFLAHIL